VAFSPDGQWLATGGEAVRVWATGSWQERIRLESRPRGGLAFSPDSRMLAFETGYGVIRLIDPNASREKEWARLEDPDQDRAGRIAFSPDGTRLVSVGDNWLHIWDLLTLRRQLADRGLDWDLPAYEPRQDSASPSDLSRSTMLVDRRTPLVDPHEYEKQLRKNIEEWTKAIQTKPRPVDSYVSRAFAYFQLADFVKARDDLEKALQLDPNNPVACNNLAWICLKGPAELRSPEKGLALAQRAVRLTPDQRALHNNLGVAYYRLRQWDGAIAALEQAARVNKGEATAFELFFLAMSYHELGDKAQARDSYDQAVEWLKSREVSLPAHQLRELKVYRAEAEAVLAIKASKSDAN
jgi:tetratricopeptide (TPR) repeat protein